MAEADDISMVGNPVYGDGIKIMINVNPDTKIIEDLEFRTFGCGAALPPAPWEPK